MFQSTHSRRVRPRTLRPFLSLSCFNPRTHEECDYVRHSTRYRKGCFNPRTHEECDFKLGKTCKVCRVSIHALTKSATIRPAMLFVSLLFQSTHSRRVRRLTSSTVSAYESFNPRTHEECDEIMQEVSKKLSVSIHALTKSATKTWYDYNQGLIVSIHALTKSATLIEQQIAEEQSFQSTHSRRVRLSAIQENTNRLCFNPRTHEECDLCLAHTTNAHRSFNPRTHEECDTDGRIRKIQTGYVSIHALTKSATKYPSVFLCSIKVSIHALTKSATVCIFYL